MQTSILDGKSNKPLFLQLKEELKRQILDKELGPGDRLPSEPELSGLFGVSRITVRKAISELVEEDVLLKRHGKGTFVCSPKIEEDVIDQMSFTLTCKVNRMTPGSRVVEARMVQASTRDIQELMVPEGSRVVHFRRVRYADEVPILLEFSYFPSEYAFLLDEDLESGSLFEILNKKHRIALKHTTKTVELAVASSEEAGLLSIKSGIPVLLSREIGYGADGRPLFRIKQVIVGDKVRFTFRN